MMKKIGLFIVSLSLLLLPFLAISVPSTVYADANTDVRTGIDAANSAGGPSVDSLIKTGLNIFSVVIGIVAVIMIMVGGFKFITANGDSSAVASARNTILYAIVGLVVAALAQAIVQFTLHKVSIPPCPAGQTQISKPGDCAR